MGKEAPRLNVIWFTVVLQTPECRIFQTYCLWNPRVLGNVQGDGMRKNPHSWQDPRLPSPFNSFSFLFESYKSFIPHPPPKNTKAYKVKKSYYTLGFHVGSGFRKKPGSASIKKHHHQNLVKVLLLSIFP